LLIQAGELAHRGLFPLGHLLALARKLGGFAGEISLSEITLACFLDGGSWSRPAG